MHGTSTSSLEEVSSTSDMEHSEPHIQVRHFPDASDSTDEVRVIDHFLASSAASSSAAASFTATGMGHSMSLARKIEQALLDNDRDSLRRIFTANPSLANVPLPVLKSPPLVAAARLGQQELVEDLLSVPGIHIDARDSEQKNAIYAACETGSLALTRLLVRHGAAVHTHCRHATPLIAACRSTNPELVDYLLKKTPHQLIDFASTGGKTALVHTIECGDIDTVKKLIAHGADPNKLGMSGRTSLHVAAELALVPIAQLLIRHGAVQRKATSGFPLDLAIRSGCIPMMELLLASPPVSDECKACALVTAVTAGKPKMLHYLLAHGVSANAALANGHSSLMMAVGLGNAEAVSLLLAHGANAAQASPAGQSALSMAIKEKRSRNLILLLLSALPEALVLDQRLAAQLIRRAKRRQDYRILNELAIKKFEDRSGNAYDIRGLLH
jgi:ankyrin repeat protein